jgi:hypothetical protein
MWVKYAVLLDSGFFFSCFVNSSTDHNLQRILSYDGLKGVVWPSGCSKWQFGVYFIDCNNTRDETFMSRDNGHIPQ